MPIDPSQIARAASESRSVLAQLRQLNSYLSLLLDRSPEPDTRVLLKCASDSVRIAMRLRHQLPALADLIDSIRREATPAEFFELCGGTDGERRRIVAEVGAMADSLGGLQRAMTKRSRKTIRRGHAAVDRTARRFVDLGTETLGRWWLLQIRRKLIG